MGRFAGPRGQAADLAAERLPNLLRKLLVGLRDFAAKLLAAATEVARIHVLLHLLADPAADRGIVIRNELQPAGAAAAAGCPPRRCAARRRNSSICSWIRPLSLRSGGSGFAGCASLPQLRSHHPDQRDDDEDDHDADRTNRRCRQQNEVVHAVAPFLLFAEAGALMRAMADRMSVSACTLRSL